MTPFDKKKAAEYFVVAWVKNWRVQTYLSAINAADIQYKDVHDQYPWMPVNLHFYFKNQYIRAWTNMAMRVINDKLWDNDDNKKRLSFAPMIERWNADKVGQTESHKQDAYERKKFLMQNKKTKLGYAASVETMRRGSGHHWNVCK